MSEKNSLRSIVGKQIASVEAPEDDVLIIKFKDGAQLAVKVGWDQIEESSWLWFEIDGVEVEA